MSEIVVLQCYTQKSRVWSYVCHVRSGAHLHYTGWVVKMCSFAEGGEGSRPVKDSSSQYKTVISWVHDVVDLGEQIKLGSGSAGPTNNYHLASLPHHSMDLKGGSWPDAPTPANRAMKSITTTTIERKGVCKPYL